MPNRVSKSQFKAKALEYFREVEISGEPIVVTDRGVAKLEVRPYRPRDRRPLDALRGSVLAYFAPTEPVGDADWDAAR
jgi:antitoxin (DNA-binding transcriptional repressor) of toxin-antitoxin stability system